MIKSEKKGGSFKYFLLKNHDARKLRFIQKLSDIVYQPEWPHISRGPRLICHAMWILECIFLFIICYQAKTVMVNKDYFLKFLTTDLFVVTYLFIVTSLVCIFCTRTYIDMHFCAVQILHIHYQVYDQLKYTGFIPVHIL
jgi:hypothetical protein